MIEPAQISMACRFDGPCKIECKELNRRPASVLNREARLNGGLDG